MLSNKLLEIRHLEKSFGSFKAVNDISLHVNKGDIYGFLGPNGAGKSTTLRMVLGLIKPNKGEILISNKSIEGNDRKFLNNIGALIEKPDFYKNLSALDNLKILFKMSQLKNKNRISEVLNEVNLWDKRNQKVGGYSQGMKQRLGIAQTLLHQPSLIILDEPSNGLDPQGQAAMRNLILRINKDMGITIIISSHILSEIEKIANRMVVINKGQKILEGNVKELMAKELLKVNFKTESVEDLKDLLSNKKIDFEVRNNNIIALINEENIPLVIEDIVKNNISIQEVRQMRTLEELFLGLTQ
ncbi:MAG: ABC transporter ATP-binding protein [Flavobacteriales bacterium]|nr:ABC transporter ATP-binding protein [Flavobacteriales bacterium]MDG1439166.1 ABC transporter ATP-binding protein [Flavobacteriales bacterium]MDG1798441.1 ABC transporter ATP-binding protein [Flavobacteriales bacterium]